MFLAAAVCKFKKRGTRNASKGIVIGRQGLSCVASFMFIWARHPDKSKD